MWSTGVTTTTRQHYVLAIYCCFLAFLRISGQAVPCVPMDFGKGSVVCVCNSTYCDEIGAVAIPPAGQYAVYTTTKGGKRFEADRGTFQNPRMLPYLQVHIRPEQRRQTILGFGGAFTDAAAVNIDSLSRGTQNQLLRAYYSDDGIEYTIGRVPIGGTDFSNRPYTYDDGHDGDFGLDYFKLQPEDLELKIPLIQMARNVSGSRLVKLFASAWSAPAWMKTNGAINGSGVLKGEPGGVYYQTWADYYVRFFEAYANLGITFWGVTSENEPSNGLVPFFQFNCMGFTPQTLRTFIGDNLGPALEAAGYGNIRLMMLDDQRLLMPTWSHGILDGASNASRYVTGIAYHWYWNSFSGLDILDQTHDDFPDIFILSTEACEGTSPLEDHVILGSWERAESYTQDIIENLNHWVVGWVDWNLALNQQGGPTWAENFVDSPIIVDANLDRFYKQPMFYALGHFSKFLQPGSVVLGVNDGIDILGQIQYAVAERDDQSIVLVVLNKSAFSKSINIIDSGFKSFGIDVPPNSIQTYIWQRD